MHLNAFARHAPGKGGFKNVILAMKLTVILMLAACLQVSARGYAQQITLSEKNTSLKRVFEEMRRQTGYLFFYDVKELKKSKPVTLSIRNAGLQEALELCLKDQPLTYTIVNRTVVVKKKEEEKELPSPPPVDISGKVTNQKGEPLAGVTVVIKGTKKGNITDENGLFKITVPGDEKTVIEFSFIGYETQTLPVSKQTTLQVVLIQTVSDLNSLVVIGYGTTKKTSLTAAVSTLQGGSVSQKPVPDLSNNLVGRIPGIIADQGSGEPGQDGARIRIRGSSTTGGADPLLVVDGIPRSFAQLDPGSIESYTVLKDAAAVAPYGLAGANGVILITTKKGKTGAPTLSYNGYVGFQNPTRMPEMVNSYQFALLENEANANSGVGPAFTPTQIQEYQKTVNGAKDADPNQYPNSRGLRDVVQRNAVLTYHNLELSGGTERVKYYAAMAYTSQEGQFVSTYLKKYNVDSRLDVKATNTTNVSLAINGYVVDQHYAGKSSSGNYSNANGGILYQAFRTPPTSPIWYTNGLWGSYIGRSLVGYISHSGYVLNENTQMYSTFSIEQQLPFIKGLSIKGTASYDPYNTYSKQWQTPILSYAPDFTTTPYTYTPAYTEFSAPQLDLNLSQNKAFTYQGYLNYHNTFGLHDITFLGVVEERNQKYWNVSAERINFPIDIDQLDQGGTTAGAALPGGSASSQAQIGYVYRASYSYDGKYLAEVAGRYDGHYDFAPGHQYAFFPAFSLGWNIGRENFIQKNFSWVDHLKIRGSYGKSGNLASGPYQWLAGYGLYGNAAVFNGGAGANPTTGIYELTPQANPYITWEVAKKTDLGIDGSFWNGLLTISADYFYERRDNMLVNPTVTVPAEYGTTLPQVNGGVESNHGIELQLGTTHSFHNGPRLEVTGTFTYARNKLLQVFETAATYDNPNRRQTGRSNGTQFGYKALGYFTPADFEANGSLKPGIASIPNAPVQPGDVKYADLSGPNGKPDGIIDQNDNTVIGRPNGSPQMIFGLAPTLSYKGIDLNFLLQGAAQVTLPLGGSLVMPFSDQGSASELAYKDHWTPANPNALYPRVYSQQPSYNTAYSSLWLRDASYLKLRSLELGYSLPYSLVKRCGMQRLRAYVAGQNLWTWTPHMKETIDPEASSGSGQYYFQQRTISFGFNATF